MFTNTEQLKLFILQKVKEGSLTKFEKQVLEIICSGDDFEDMPTQAFHSIMYQFKGSKTQLKGILGSLFKKNKIMIGEYPNGYTAYHSIINK